MGSVIGDLLPVAVAVAISPVPVIAVILMLLTPGATRTGLAFLGGWVLGISVVVAAVVLVVDPVDDSESGGPSTLVSVLQVLLGLAALALAVRQWRGRPRGDAPAALPGWMTALDSVTPLRGLGLGALLSGANPKNLTLCLSAGVVVAGAGLSSGDTVVVVALFVVLASCSVAVPVVGYLVWGARLRGPLDELGQWLTGHSTAVMSVLLLVMGSSILGKGLGGLA